MASLLIFSFLSCKKDTNTPDKPADPVTEHYPSKVGSYWVYHWYSIDSNGVETLLSEIDTISIVGDTLLSGKKYAIYKEMFMGWQQNLTYRRDSSGYIVDQLGQVRYSYVNFKDSFEMGSDTGIWNYYSKMFNKPDKVQVPAGSFSCVERRKVHYNDPAIPLTACGDTVITFGTYYSPSVGEIKSESGWYMELKRECKKRERRLVSYYLP